MAAAAGSGASVVTRQPTIHLLRSPIVKWLQSEFAITNRTVQGSVSNSSSTSLARNRLLRAAPTLFLSHRPNDIHDKHFISTRIKSSSVPPTNVRSSQQQKLQKKHLERVSHQVYTTCTHQLSWRCVPSCAIQQNNHTSHLIASKDRKELWDLSSRTGASNVMAVGSSAAMYLAKSMTTTDPDQMEEEANKLRHQNTNSNYQNHNVPTSTTETAATLIHQQRILIPLTYDAVWASTTSHVLLLSHPFSPNEPMLSPLPASIPTFSMVVLDPPSLWGSLEDRNVAYQAAVALALDAMYWQLQLPTPSNTITSPTSEEYSWKPILQQWVDLQQQKEKESDGNDNDEMAVTTLQSLASMGAMTRFGLTETPPAHRSIPLAIAASLLPRILIAQEVAGSSPGTASSTDVDTSSGASSRSPHDDTGMLFLRIMASLVPGLLRLVVSMTDNKENGATIGINGDDDKNDIAKLLNDLEQLVDHPTTIGAELPSTLHSLASPLLSLSSQQNHAGSNPDVIESRNNALLDIIFDLVQENREHWNCQDVDDAVLEDVVYDSLDTSP